MYTLSQFSWTILREVHLRCWTLREIKKNWKFRCKVISSDVRINDISTNIRRRVIMVNYLICICLDVLLKPMKIAI